MSITEPFAGKAVDRLPHLEPDEDPGLRPYAVEIAAKEDRCSFCLRPVKAPELYHKSCYRRLWGTSKALIAQLDGDQPLLTFSRTVHEGS